MPENESVLVVPLRSNASTLLTGAPIAALRRRLKFASLFYDHLLLETGIFRAYAGPTGVSSFIVPPTEQDPPRWQTPTERHAGTGATFAVAVGRDGSHDATPHAVISSEASISWTATLHPFADELPPSTDWVDFVKSLNPEGAVKQLAQQWIEADERNRSLERAIPVRFVRDSVIQSANRDLVLAVASGSAVTVDPLHLQVVAQRFKDDDGWRLRGYAVPILLPQVGNLCWEAIGALRRDRHIARFRAVLQEVEEEAAAEAAGGDIEAAANQVFARHLAAATGRLEDIGTIAHRTLRGFVIGGITGLACSGIIGPLGTVAGAAAGAVPTTIVDVRDMIRQSRSRGWVTVYQRITG